MNLGQVQWTMELAVIVLLLIMACWWLLFGKAIGFSHRQLIDWFRSFPKAWRYLTDREYRQKRDAITGAVNVYGLLLTKMLADRAIVRIMEKRADSHPRGAQAAADEYEKSKRVLATLFRELNDEALDAIALYVHDDILEKKVPLVEVVAFYVEEKKILTNMPCLVGDHVERFLARFARQAVL